MRRGLVWHWIRLHKYGRTCGIWLGGGLVGLVWGFGGGVDRRMG